MIILLILFTVTLCLNCFLPLLRNDNFNPEGDSLETRFILIGPDPYYNMRTCQQYRETGLYPVIGKGDPLLNYPFADKGARPPLLNVMTVSIANFFGGSEDNLGWTMLVLPCIFGALLVFPLYGIGKELFDKRIGLISATGAFFVPVLISADHGSLFGLFDHDSLILFLLLSIIFCYMKTIISEGKKTYIYGFLTSFLLFCVHITWVSPIVIYAFIVCYLLLQLFFDAYRERYYSLIYTKTYVIFLVTFAMTAPYMFMTTFFNFLTYTLVVVMTIFCIYASIELFRVKKIYSLSFLFSIVIMGFISIYYIHIKQIEVQVISNMANNIFSGAYTRDKIFSTIAEGQVKNIFTMFMEIGPVVYIFGFLGIVFYLTKSYIDNFKPKNILFLSTILVSLFVTTQAGRFMVFLAPFLFILSVYTLKIIMKQLSLKKKIFSLFIALLFVVPSTLVISSDIISPSRKFGFEHQMIEVGSWLKEQHINVSPAQKPAILGWWDYGFHIVTIARNPVVADNYQSGVNTASSFFTVNTEKEVIATLCIRLIEWAGTERTETIIKEYFERGEEIINIINSPEIFAPSYGKLISPEYGNTFLTVEKQNAIYIDIIDIMSEEDIDFVNDFYLDLINITGKKIGYLMVTERDLEILYPVIVYLADKGTWLDTFEDDYFDKDLKKKDIVYDTMVHKIYGGEEMLYFDEVYRENGAVIVKYIGDS